MQDLARLLFVARVVDLTLTGGERGQRVHHLAWQERARLVSGDDAVAAEQCDEPRDAGGDETPAGLETVGHAQRIQVGQRAVATATQVGRVAEYLDVGDGVVWAGVDIVL